MTFAWIAADPDARFARWQKEDATKRLDADRDFERFGVTLLEPDVRSALQRQLDTTDDKGRRIKLPPNVPDRATAADEYWGPRLNLPREGPDLASFRGVYTTVYRRGNSRTHATLLGLNDVLEATPQGMRVALESSGRQPSVRMAPLVLGLAMYVASHAIGWPERRTIDAAFDELAKASQTSG